MACTYCLPYGFKGWEKHQNKINAEQAKVILQGYHLLGFEKVRFTGGEPSVHPNARDFISIARDIGYKEIGMTSNGSFLHPLKEWKNRGLSSLNLSLDSLDAERFHKITKSRLLPKILRLVDDAISLGLPLKINTVLIRSMNGEDIESLMEWALHKPIVLRFIELMPTHLNSPFEKNERVSGQEIESTLIARGFVRTGRSKQSIAPGPAVEYKHPDFPGAIGLINPMSCNFCDECNRLRVTARATVRTCLFSEKETSLDLSSPENLASQIERLIPTKSKQHELLDGRMGDVATFRMIGG